MIHPHQIIKTVFPDADSNILDHVLFGCTSFPFGKITAKEIYKAASRYKRACNNNIQLCDFCSSKAVEGKYACESCGVILKKATDRNISELIVE